MQIPSYPEMRLLNAADSHQLQEHFQTLQPEISEFCFANLYLFRYAHRYALSLVGESLVIFGQGYGGEPYFLPPLSGDRGKTARMLLAAGHDLYGADEEFVASHLAPAGINAVEDRNSFDYLYLREELATLPGNRFHKKKNRINYFTARHSFSVEPFSADHLPGALQLLREWRRVQEAEAGSPLDLEAEATEEALNMAGELGLSGVVVLLEGRVAAFALGEQLNRETAVCHFEKTDPFVEGIAQLVNREFSRRLFTDCTFINREQDLGEPGLREAKISYHPVRLVKKFRVAGV
ncbi:MAG TPA: phosphatidylglycerol lysyltransferase domain-containing protein [Geobacteraceae bacterium]|nr:phosphatidylglycerol lysyltransferase domain-containing protein [Geobacteraceae bacterium]